MNKNFALLLLLLVTLPGCLSAQMTTPRMLEFRIVNSDGSPLARDTTGLEFKATLLGMERNHRSYNFGYFYAENCMYAKIQLGNFGVQWAPGDTVNFVITKQDSTFSMGKAEITIPDGVQAIWWGRPSAHGKDYPGEPVRLYPFILHIVAQDPGIPVLINGKATALVTGTPVTAKTKDDITGIFSLAPPPSGYRWEPAKYLVTPRDFEFSESAYTDAEGVARPGWARTLEFRLVPEE